MRILNRGCTWNCSGTDHHPRCQYYRADERAAEYNNASPEQKLELLEKEEDLSWPTA